MQIADCRLTIPDRIFSAICNRYSAIVIAFFLVGCSSTGFEHGMENQEKAKPLTESSFFPDGRASRPQVPGTVARGHENEDELLYTGKLNGKEASVFPFPVTREVLERGRERYTIYCAVCHDRAGTGNGIVVRRGFQRPPSYHEERLRQAPVGHFFDVATNGFGSMYAYADRVSVSDRWAIAAYIRALQYSQHAPVQDLPDSDRQQLSMNKSSK
jgi:mono/diheme cytochrome c family protein